MAKRRIMQRVGGAVLGVAITILLASWTARGSEARTENGKGSGPGPMQAPSGQQPSTAPSPAPPAERNPAIVDLEKKIAGQENKPAEEVFRNIQMFKGQPAIRVLRIMEMGFVPALGVRCVFCHVPNQWDRDDKKHKVIARKMVTLTQNLNKEVKELTDEKAAVNCYTCHRGQEKPALSPQPAKPETPSHEHEP
jgi:hypothetical protein